MNANPIIFEHPLIQHKLAIVRDKSTGTKEFRELVEEISGLMCFEATRNLPLKETCVTTPMGPANTKTLSGKKLVVVPVLRAGLGMVDGILKMVPSAKVGHIGIYRDSNTHLPIEYYCKLPSDINERQVFVLDPMLATGGSAIDAITLIKGRGATNIHFLCIIAAPEGLEALTKAHPDVSVYCAALDERLDENKYIIPGLGDAGDRIFGTK